MNILITGSNGFIGKNLANAFRNIQLGYDKTHPEISIENIYLYDIDTDESLLNQYCSEADFVFNFAGVNRTENQSDFTKGNTDFLFHLLNTLKKKNNMCPVMLSSSIQAVLDNPYGRSKKAAEDILIKYSESTGCKCLIYRFPNVFGKWCKPNYNSVIATFCNNIANDLPVTVHNTETELTLIYIDDLVKEMIHALSGNENSNGIFCEVPVSYKKKLGFIEKTINNFRNMSEECRVPDFEDAFVSKLYSTYLTYLPKEKMISSLKMNTDERGSFTELIRTPDRGQLSVNISKPGIIKGNHWHQSKNERFIVVKGHGLIQMRKIGTDSNGHEYPVIEFEVFGERIQSVEMIPGYAHNIINLSDTEDLITFIWANECFDTEHPDTYYEKV